MKPPAICAPLALSALLKKIKDGEFTDGGVNVTMINVDRKIIYGYGTKNPCQHFLINCNNGEEKIFPDESQWEQALEKLGIDHKTLFDVFDVFEDFKENKILPWKKF